MESCYIAPPRKLRSLAMQREGGSMAAFAHDFDFRPPDVPIPTSPQRLHRRLLGGESRGVTLIAWAPTRLAIDDFALGENTRPKAPSGRRAGYGAFDPRDLDNIHTGSDDRHTFA